MPYKNARSNQVYQGAWAGRPAANAVPVGSTMVVTDFGVGGYSQWYSDGTYWRPVGGRLVLYQRTSESLATPLASITASGGLNQAFTIPDVLRIPAGMLFPNCWVQPRAYIRRTAVGAGGVTVNSLVSLGTTNTFGDPTTSALGMAAVVNSESNNSARCFISQTITNGYIATNFFPEAGTTTAAQVMRGSINMAADNFVNIGFNSASVAGDVFILTAYQLSVEM